MTDCTNCGFPNPASMGPVLCRNCGRLIPDEATPQSPPGLGYVRLIAWGSAAVASAASTIFWWDECRSGQLWDVVWIVMLIAGLLAFAGLIALASMTLNRWEVYAAIAILVLGTGINLLFVADSMYKAMTFSPLTC